MGIPSGELNTVVEVLEHVKNKNELNETKNTWVAVERAWARIDPISTRDFVNSGAEGSALVAKIILRGDIYVSGANRIRILDTGEVYNIEGIVPIPNDFKKAILCSSGAVA